MLKFLILAIIIGFFWYRYVKSEAGSAQIIVTIDTAKIRTDIEDIKSKFNK